MIEAEKLVTKILQREAKAGDYKTYRAALEWDLIDPIVIEDKEDLKSKQAWEERVEPFHHQVTNLMTFCRRLPVTLLADDVGLGKTISAGLIVSELAARNRVSKILVVAPKLLGGQWKEELETKFNIPAIVATGRELKSADPGESGAVITTYNSARMHLDKLPADRYQMLILDEAHKLRNLFGVGTPPQVATKFQQALKERRFQYVLMLTATPIQNRLWDLYSLVDLLAAARGHNNPFGSEGLFARKYIADDREKARQLKPEAKEDFQSIVYDYMSRVRRGDANLYFPDRIVRMEKITPSQGELALIDAIARPIQSLGILVQISILQALASSPEALSAQLENMGRKGTVPTELVTQVKRIVSTMPTAAKLEGLGRLIERLQAEDTAKWRLVVFTTRRETQTTIDAFLSQKGLNVALINGNTAGRNAETIKGFWADPPIHNVIVSTEAGSEGVNLQIANVLVNYDLPWNPMIVEQRIGRIQRLASKHANVSIFNMTLKGTFEEYIVGRLMEKLQMAAHAIGDIESLLEASDLDKGTESSSFEETIRQLVVAALTGADVDEAARRSVESIDVAKAELERERQNIDSLIGDMDGSGEVGPRAPRLPPIERSTHPRDFVISALKMLGQQVMEEPTGRISVEHGATRFYGAFEPNQASDKSILFLPGTSAFQRLVSRVLESGIHTVSDVSTNAGAELEKLVVSWASAFEGAVSQIDVASVERRFSGRAIARVRATVQHDAYERIVEIECAPEKHVTSGDRSFLEPSAPLIEDVRLIGLDTEAVQSAASHDPAVAEFRRFYLERRAIEERAAGDDDRKRYKLHEDFSPRLTTTLVGLEGRVSRSAKVKVTYTIDGKFDYTDSLSLELDEPCVSLSPRLGLCASSGRQVPIGCLVSCSFTGAMVIRHLLTKSETSGRYAQSEFATTCAVSGKQILKDEAEISGVTGANITRELLKTSVVSAIRGEPSYFVQCEITLDDVLATELVVSELSGRKFRSDQSAVSEFSGKRGHETEFVECHDTHQLIARVEAEQCESTGSFVRSGLLGRCEISDKRVLTSELGRCSLTGQRMLEDYLVTSSESQRRFQGSKAVQARQNDLVCTEDEAIVCAWSGSLYHPSDIGICLATSLKVGLEHLDNGSLLAPVKHLLDLTVHSQDRTDLWPDIEAQLSAITDKRKPGLQAAVLSPNGTSIAVRAKVKTLLGMRTDYLCGVFSVSEGNIVGRIARPKDIKS